MRQSWSSFHRILPALRSNSVALQHRVLVWQSCVLSTLMHGLDSAGLAPGGSTLLHKHVVRQLRLVSKAPSYITHEAPETLRTRLRVADPLETLRLRVQRRIQNCREGHMASLQPKPVHHWWQQLEDNLRTAAVDPQQLQHHHPMSVPTRLVALAQPVKPVPCPTCGFYFPTTRILRIHIALKHKSSTPSSDVTSQPARRPQSEMRRDFMQHSQSGLPMCRHCTWVFTSWPSFCMHFERARCPVLHKDVSLALPPGSARKDSPTDIPNLPTRPSLMILIQHKRIQLEN